MADVRAVAVPSRVRELSRLGRIDYEDAFRVELGRPADERTAEEWARAAWRARPRPCGEACAEPGLRSG